MPSRSLLLAVTDWAGLAICMVLLVAIASQPRQTPDIPQLHLPRLQNPDLEQLVKQLEESNRRLQAEIQKIRELQPLEEGS